MSEVTGTPIIEEDGEPRIPRLLERAKLAFVIVLREAFASSIADENLKYSNDDATTKLKIWTAHPLELEFYPSIVVAAAGTDMSFSYLSDDFVEETGSTDTDEVIFAGRLVFTLSLTSLTRSTLERERIMDHLIIFLRFLFRDRIHGFGIEYTRDIRIGPEVLTEVENVPVYEQTVDIPCYMEYETKLDQRTLDTFREICISVGI